MSEQQSPAAAGRLATNTGLLRSFGHEITGHSATLKGLEIGDVVSGASMPGSAVERALAAAAQACGTALARVCEDYVFAGDESVKDSRWFEEHEDEQAAGSNTARSPNSSKRSTRPGTG